ncbi:MAG: methyltransferase domain-containing protein [Bacteroidales bacterium]|nr:methyltransferase domain-containing protein [Bacteroidales bacterium]
MLRSLGLQLRKPSGLFGKIVSAMLIKWNRNRYEILINDLKIQPNDKLFEIGYGPGLGINLISKEYESCQVYGIDFSELMYLKATKRNKQFIVSNRVKLMFGDFLETEIGIRDFDKVFCLNVVYFWDNLQKPFEKVISLLKDDGLFYIYMDSKEDLSKATFAEDDIFNKYTIEQVHDALKLAGFKEIDYYFDNGYFVKAKK